MTDELERWLADTTAMSFLIVTPRVLGHASRKPADVDLIVFGTHSTQIGSVDVIHSWKKNKARLTHDSPHRRALGRVSNHHRSEAAHSSARLRVLSDVLHRRSERGNLLLLGFICIGIDDTGDISRPEIRLVVASVSDPLHGEERLLA